MRVSIITEIEFVGSITKNVIIDVTDNGDKTYIDGQLAKLLEKPFVAKEEIISAVDLTISNYKTVIINPTNILTLTEIGIVK